MFSKIFVAALAIAPLAAAHGRVDVVTGDAGGNGTALAIKGGIVPGPGPNSKVRAHQPRHPHTPAALLTPPQTEVDTTVFGKTNILSDGLGRTTGSGQNNINMIVQAMALSGNTLPQVSATGGNISGVFHIVTTDGAGPIQAVLDPTGTGKFSKGVPLTVLQQIPGNNGNIAPGGGKNKKQGKRSEEPLWARALMAAGIMKRAANVNESFDFKFSVPAGTKCEGSVAGMNNVCLVKIANSNKAGPFGGVVPVQIAAAGAANGGQKQTADKACARSFTA